MNVKLAVLASLLAALSVSALPTTSSTLVPTAAEGEGRMNVLVPRGNRGRRHRKHHGKRHGHHSKHRGHRKSRRSHRKRRSSSSSSDYGSSSSSHGPAEDANYFRSGSDSVSSFTDPSVSSASSSSLKSLDGSSSSSSSSGNSSESSDEGKFLSNDPEDSLSGSSSDYSRQKRQARRASKKHRSTSRRTKRSSSSSSESFEEPSRRTIRVVPRSRPLSGTRANPSRKSSNSSSKPSGPINLRKFAHGREQLSASSSKSMVARRPGTGDKSTAKSSDKDVLEIRKPTALQKKPPTTPQKRTPPTAEKRKPAPSTFGDKLRHFQKVGPIGVKSAAPKSSNGTAGGQAPKNTGKQPRTGKCPVDQK